MHHLVSLLSRRDTYSLRRRDESLRERGVERARAKRLVRDLDLGVASAAHRRHDRVASVERECSELVLRELDPPDRAVMTNAENLVAETLERELGAIDLRERGWIQLGSVRDARSGTRRGGLFRARHSELERERAHLRFRDAGLEQWVHDAVALCRRAEER